MVKEFFQKSFVIFTTMAICVILLETGLRILGKNPSNMTEGIYEDNGKDSYRLQKNISKRNNWSAFSYTVYTNSFGFRDKEIRDVDLSNKDFIMFIGDSQTFASGVDYEKTFIGVIADHLAQKNICGHGRSLPKGGLQHRPGIGGEKIRRRDYHCRSIHLHVYRHYCSKGQGRFYDH